MPWEDVGRLNKPVVRRAWRTVLSDWLRWDPARVDSWLEIFDPEIRDEGNPFFYHDSIMSFVVGLLVADELADRLPTRELMALRWRLERVFDNDRDSVWNEDFDWADARNAIDAILGEYGATIPDAGVVTAFERRLRQNPPTPAPSVTLRGQT